MSETVDRVAEAISAQIDGPEHTHPVFEPEFYKAMARAAIEAMREPTKAMCKAADALENQDWRDKGEREDGATHWQAMIGEALR